MLYPDCQQTIQSNDGYYQTNSPIEPIEYWRVRQEAAHRLEWRNDLGCHTATAIEQWQVHDYLIANSVLQFTVMAAENSAFQPKELISINDPDVLEHLSIVCH
ncbi:hypothetical protein [Vibrio sp. WXL103]|uniref:hypothetical protein n=1 Tax=Vibrio sp. WXL103 TaxID=3450710 RepID=UPI003EC6E813